MRRALLLTGFLCLSVPAFLAAQQSANGIKPEPWENMLGSWKQLPPDDPTTLKIESEGSGIKISYGCKQDGSCSSFVTGNYDGKLSKYSDNANWAASFRKMGDRTIQQDTYFDGKLDVTDKRQLSPERNTLSVTNQVVSRPESKTITSIYDRNGGPVSKNDPFVGFWKRDWNKSDPSIITYAARATCSPIRTRGNYK